MFWDNPPAVVAHCPLCAAEIDPGIPCGHCHAPAKVIASIEAREQPPRFLGVLGPSGVGKTVYLGMLLDLLARGTAGLRGAAQGPFSLALHRNVMMALERQRFPEKTPVEADRWQWVHCEVARGTGRRETRFDIVTPDVAGEAVMAELERPHSHRAIRALIARCEALVVLADITEILAGSQSQELFAMQLVSYLDSLQPAKSRGKSKRKLTVPVAVVFTKADLCEEPIPDPSAFARANTPALWRLCEDRLERFRFSCAGVAGSCGRLLDEDGRAAIVPLRIEPRGVVEPFVWLMDQVR
jgi:hypothetical protein